MKKKIVKDKPVYQFNLTHAFYNSILRLLNQGLWVMDPDGDPDSTNFSYCVHCGIPEYAERHKSDCRGEQIIKKFEDSLIVIE